MASKWRGGSRMALLGAALLVTLSSVSLAVAAPKEGEGGKKPDGKKGDAKVGKKLFSSRGCTGCHKTPDYPGGDQGPDLSHVGKKYSTPQIVGIILDPRKALKQPATIMPKLMKGAQPDTEGAENIAAYLSGLK